MNSKLTLLIVLTVFSFYASAETAAWSTWKAERLAALQKPNGWLTLVGMEWLKQGKNSMGSDEGNDVVLSHGPGHLGDIHLNADDSITFVPNTDSGIRANDTVITSEIPVHADSSDQDVTIFTVDTFEFYVIERDKMALRIKDSEAKTRTEFEGLSYFPENEALRITAKFEPYQPKKIIPIVNVMGQLNESPSPGRLVFTIDGVEHDIDVLDSVDDYYIIFGDKTNGRSTYGPGRFVYTDGLPNEQGEVVLDFNKAYNPPCAFTAYSTCSLPPRSNRLPVAIEAGEKKYGNSVY